MFTCAGESPFTERDETRLSSLRVALKKRLSHLTNAPKLAQLRATFDKSSLPGAKVFASFSPQSPVGVVSRTTSPESLHLSQSPLGKLLAPHFSSLAPDRLVLVGSFGAFLFSGL